jgi:hypothetical protein
LSKKWSNKFPIKKLILVIANFAIAFPFIVNFDPHVFAQVSIDWFYLVAQQGHVNLIFWNHFLLEILIDGFDFLLFFINLQHPNQQNDNQNWSRYDDLKFKSLGSYLKPAGETVLPLQRDNFVFRE